MIPKGKCRECGELRTVTKAGVVRNHTTNGRHCYGSGLSPVGGQQPDVPLPGRPQKR